MKYNLFKQKLHINKCLSNTFKQHNITKYNLFYTFNPFVVGSIPAQPTNKKQRGLREIVTPFVYLKGLLPLVELDLFR